MEVDEASSSNFASDYSVNYGIQSVENGLRSMTLDKETHQLGVPDMRSDNVSTRITDLCSSTLEKFSLPQVPCSFFECKAETPIEQFQKEREDTTFSRSCLFCRRHFIGNRSLLLDHLLNQHSFYLGQPDNLVYINEYLDILEDLLNKLQCIYCKKIFKDWSVLKEHMRKKVHRRINPNDSSFNKFYMINYLETYHNRASPFKMKSVPKECNTGFSLDEETEIEMNPVEENILCLYCEDKYFNREDIMHHLKVVHEFDFKHLEKEYNLCFYSQVKLINYIRKKVLSNECTICDVSFASRVILVQHMTDSGHIKLLPERINWDQPQFYFPTLDGDYLLYNLNVDDDNDNSAVEIIAEDIVLPTSSILADENLRRTLL